MKESSWLQQEPLSFSLSLSLYSHGKSPLPPSNLSLGLLWAYKFFGYVVVLKLSGMEQEVFDSLQKLRLTKEEEDILITNTSRSNLIEECSLSLFGHLLMNQHQNQRAFKNTLRQAWKMGSNLRIVEVGKDILQFKFNSMYQLDQVEKVGRGTLTTTFSFYAGGGKAYLYQMLPLPILNSRFKYGACLLSICLFVHHICLFIVFLALLPSIAH